MLIIPWAGRRGGSGGVVRLRTVPGAPNPFVEADKQRRAAAGASGTPARDLSPLKSQARRSQPVEERKREDAGPQFLILP
ncbi:MAG: hypothetical protein PW734_09295 [Verrucomicrobium sp.]|nr:hypothetical protein [Verrucomicrobium sp.]